MLVQDSQQRQWERDVSVAHVVSFEERASEGASQRGFAREQGVPRTTLQYWLARKRAIDASPAVVAFFESPDGVAFLHRLVISLHFVMGFVSGFGLRPVALVLDLAGLSRFVANSLGSRQKLGTEMEAEIRAFAQQQGARLGKQMPAKRITLCEDETFHPEPCLVAIEPVSNFILVEEYADGRDAETWNAAVKEALGDLPVRVIQSTSDEGKGLLAHVRAGLGAHHSPDVFHVQQELSRATSVALAGQVRQAEKAKEEAVADTQAQRAEAEAWPHVEHGPGRPPNFEAHIARAEDAEDKAEQALNLARQQQERAHRAVRGVGKAHHPVDLTTGAVRSAEQVTTDLEHHFAEIAAVAEQTSLPERCRKGIQKAHRLVPALACTVYFFRTEVEAQIAALGLTPEQARVVEQRLVPAAYLARAANKASPADTRPPIRDLAERLRADAQPILAPLAPDRRAAIERVAQDCADLFQRSSSCVEGRNGQLALRHHSLHHITPTRLEALTAVHNYFIRRRDGTTAAERFFGVKPADLFDWLLDHLDLPARPASKRGQQGATPLLN